MPNQNQSDRFSDWFYHLLAGQKIGLEVASLAKLSKGVSSLRLVLGTVFLLFCAPLFVFKGFLVVLEETIISLNTF